MKLPHTCFLGVLVGLAITTDVHAGFLLPFTGYTRMKDPAATGTSISGLVNFAVYETTDADWTNDFGASVDASVTSLPGGGSVDTNTFRVFFYEVVNDTSLRIDQLLVPGGGQYTSAGYLSGFVFHDAPGPSGRVGQSLNKVIGLEPPPGDPDDPVDGIPSANFRTLDSAPFATIGGTKVPISASLNSGGFATVTWPTSGPNALVGGIAPARSPVLFFTSDLTAALTYLEGRIQRPATSPTTIADGDLPALVPEPSSILLVSMGALGLCGFCRRGSKQKLALCDAV